MFCLLSQHKTTYLFFIFLCFFLYSLVLCGFQAFLCCFYWFVFDSHKIDIGKPTFIGYNDKKEIFIFSQIYSLITTKYNFFNQMYTFYTKTGVFYVNYV